MKKLSLRVVQGFPMLNIESELKATDFAPVQETKNAIDFIMGGGDGWKKEKCVDGERNVLKIRLLDAPNLHEEIRKARVSGEITLSNDQIVILANIYKVYRVSTKDAAHKEAFTRAVHVEALAKATKAVEEFNMMTMAIATGRK